MKRLLHRLLGFWEIRATGASPHWLLNAMSAAGVSFWEPHFEDAFTVTFFTERSELPAVEKAALRSMCRLERVQERGAPQRYRGLGKRWLLLVMLMLAVGAAIVLPKFVWFYKVEGNVKVPAEKILRLLPEAGVRVGTYGPNIVPQRVKNQMLLLIPELEWLTVTQQGGCATVVVRERTPRGKVIERREPTHLVAARGGLITSVEAWDGAALVKKGDTVTPGQVLISGAVDLEYKTRLCTAAGEVYARTWRELHAVTPASFLEKQPGGSTHAAWFLTVGRKRIKICGNTSFFSAGCDKITEEMPLTLPGGHTLPICLVRETVRECALSPCTEDESGAQERLQKVLTAYVQEDMIAGEITAARWEGGTDGEVYGVHGELECREMIARAVRAEILKNESDENGTDRQRGTDGAAH